MNYLEVGVLVSLVYVLTSVQLKGRVARSINIRPMDNLFCVIVVA